VDDELNPISPLHLGSSAWAIRRDALPTIIEAHRSALRLGREVVAETIAPRAAVGRATQRAGGSVAVIPLCGVITPRGSFLARLFGAGGGLQEFRESFRQALVDPDVGAIVIDVDSPGGTIALLPETAQEMRDARGTKPIIAVANTTAASAAYWLAAQADEVVASPSAVVGSVGVYMVHEDWSKYNEELGVDPTYISAGRYKTDGNPDEPLSDTAQVEWQEEVDLLYTMFVKDLAAGRGASTQAIEADFGEGRCLRPAQALEAGMIDRIDTIEAVIGGLLEPGSSGSRSASAGRLALTAPVDHAPVASVVPVAEPSASQEPEAPPATAPSGEPAVLDAETRRAHADLLFG
jgi:signal peptide peptidase SppA